MKCESCRLLGAAREAQSCTHSPPQLGPPPRLGPPPQSVFSAPWACCVLQLSLLSVWPICRRGGWRLSFPRTAAGGAAAAAGGALEGDEPSSLASLLPYMGLDQGVRLIFCRRGGWRRSFLRTRCGGRGRCRGRWRAAAIAPRCTRGSWAATWPRSTSRRRPAPPCRCAGNSEPSTVDRVHGCTRGCWTAAWLHLRRRTVGAPKTLKPELYNRDSKYCATTWPCSTSHRRPAPPRRFSGNCKYSRITPRDLAVFDQLPEPGAALSVS